MNAFPPDWLTPDWPAPPGVRALCTTRAGGASRPPYDSFNLGDHVGDDPLAVRSNRAALQGALQARPVFLQQVHGTQVLTLRGDEPDGSVADGCVTTRRGLACTIMVADCLPVLLAHRSGRLVGAAHAGWRGLAGATGPQHAAWAGGGILEQIFRRFMALAPVDTGDAAIKSIANEVVVWLGPCIGPEAFEVGPEVKAAFEAHDAQAAAMFRPHTPGKWLANLPGLARQRLAALGVTQVYGNDGSAGWCTVANASRFFSHRRDRVSGRLAACVWLA